MTMKSMTGYGRGSAEADGNRVTVEITAVNSRKQVEMRFALPKELAMLEPSLRQAIQQRLSRGSLNVAVNYRLAHVAYADQARINVELGAAIAIELRRLARAIGKDDVSVSLSDLLQIPGVVTEGTGNQYELLSKLVVAALQVALDELDRSRRAEGLRLREDLLARGEQMKALLSEIEGRADEAVQLQRQRLLERMKVLGLDLNLDDERLLKEVAFYAERADITEETVRLRSHLQQFDALLDSGDEPGRALDFLGQEMNREISTLSAKTADLDIARTALALKGEIGRVREQVMNIE